MSLAQDTASQNGDADGHVGARPERVQDDWQVAYTWAFIVKFGLLEKIKRLENLDDFERSLVEPVANRPDDPLEGVLIRFMMNLRPGLARTLSCENIQSHVSNYIAERLVNSPEFTVWDKPWLPNEEARGSCCSAAEDRTELGRLYADQDERRLRGRLNPLKQIEEKGGGLFELDWHERAKLLRQMVDWQLSHSEVIRGIIKDQQPIHTKNGKQPLKGEFTHLIDTEPIGLDRNKNRIWSLDSSSRLYKSGNPFKRPCPLTAMTSTRAELAEMQQRFEEHGASKAPAKAPTTGAKGKARQKELLEHRKMLKGIEEEGKLATWIKDDLIPRVEKEEARVARVKRRAWELSQAMMIAESRSTRTRRSTRKVDYTYDDGSDYDYDEEEPRRARRGAGARGRDAAYDAASSSSSRAAVPVIPGERRSARVARRVEVDDDAYDDAGESATASLSVSAAPSPAAQPSVTVVVSPPDGQKRKKGYAWVEEVEPGPGAGLESGAGAALGANGSNGGQHVPIEVD